MIRCEWGLWSRWLIRQTWLLLVLGAGAAYAAPATLSNLWQLVIESRSECVPAVAPDGTIYLPNFDGKLFATTPGGTLKWVFRTGKVGKADMEIQSSPVIGRDGTVYFGCRDGRLYAVGSNGSLRWAYKTDGWVDSSPALGEDDSIYVGSWDKNFYAFDSNGQRKWQFVTRGPIVSSPSINAQGTIFFGSHDGNLYAVRPDGTKAWDYVAGAQIISSPAIDGDGALYITSVDGFFHAVNADGTSRWKLRTGGITASSPIIGQDGKLYLGVNKNLWCISREGEKVRDFPVTSDAYQQPIYSTPYALENSTVIAVSGYGLLAAYDEKPSIVWSFYLHGFGSGGPALAQDGTIYIDSAMPEVGRALTALSNSVRVARSPWPRFRGPLGNGRVPGSR